MKKITINSENRRFNISSIAIGYLDENKVEQIEFEIPQEYQNYGKKACFSANGTTFAKLFDDITSNILIITRDISQYNELDLSIEFFKTENEDEIIARTSILHIVIENAIVCEDVKPDDKKVVILNELIEKVTSLQQETTKNEEIREENEQNRIKNEEERILYYENIKEKVENGDFNGKDALINGVNTLEIVEGDNIHLEQQANVLTISNTYSYDDSQIKADIEKINRGLTNYSLITETGSKVALNINPSNYVMTLELKDKNNNTISSGNVDLPLETMVVDATYNNETKEIELSLQNGTKVSFSVADLVSGLVNEDDLNNTLKDYALKTSIPTKTSQLNNDSGFIDKSVNNLDNYYKKTEIDTKVQEINTTTRGLDTRLTTAEKNIETNKTDIKDLSNRTRRIETNIFDSGEASGTSINLQDSALAEMQELEVEGVCEQKTTGGKNLFDINNQYKVGQSFNFNGITIAYDENGYITLNGTVSKSGDIDIVPQAYTITLDKDIYLCFEKVSGSISIDKGFTCQAINKSGASIWDYYAKESIPIMKVPYSDIVSIRWLRIQVLSGMVFNNYKIRCWVSTENSLDFEPYTGGQASPSPDYPQEIKTITDSLSVTSCNKNLFDKNTITKYTYLNQTGNLTLNRELCVSDFIRVIENQEYIYQGTTIGVTYESKIGFYDKNKNFIGYSDIVKNGTSFIVPLGVYYFRTTIKLSEIDIYQLEKSSTQTSFEQHIQSQITANLPEGEFIGKINDTYKDTLKVEYNEDDGQYHLVLNKMIGKVILDGSEEWHILDLTFYTDIKWGKPKSMCTHFTNNGSIWVSNDEKLRGKYTTTNVDNQFKCMPLSDMTLVDFKTWLSENNVTIYYILKTPYTVDLGVVDMPLSYNEITNIFTDSDLLPTINVKYYRNFITTIQNLQVNNDTLKNELSNIESRLTVLENANTNVVDNNPAEESEVVTQ